MIFKIVFKFRLGQTVQNVGNVSYGSSASGLFSVQHKRALNVRRQRLAVGTVTSTRRGLRNQRPRLPPQCGWGWCLAQTHSARWVYGSMSRTRPLPVLPSHRNYTGIHRQ